MQLHQETLTSHFFCTFLHPERNFTHTLFPFSHSLFLFHSHSSVKDRHIHTHNNVPFSSSFLCSISKPRSTGHTVKYTKKKEDIYMKVWSRSVEAVVSAPTCWLCNLVRQLISMSLSFFSCTMGVIISAL